MRQFKDGGTGNDHQGIRRSAGEDAREMGHWG